MKIIFDYTVLFLFLAGCLLFGGFIVGPVSIRIYVSVLTLVYLVLSGYKFRLQRETLLYVFFIFSYLLALFMNGEIYQVDFFRYFFGRYFICLIAVYAISGLVQKQKTVEHIIYFLIGIGIVNGVFTTLQYFGYPSAMALPMYLNPTPEVQEIFEVHSRLISGLGIGVVGIYGNIVENGYISSSIAVLSAFTYNRARERCLKLLSFIIMSFLVFTVFETQQRFVFIMVGLFSVFYFHKSSKTAARIIGLFILLGIYAHINEIGLTSYHFGRVVDLSYHSRLDLFFLAIEFIKDNLLYGGQKAFAAILYANGFPLIHAAHNIFLNAFIYSGILGGLIIIALYFIMLKKAMKAAFTYMKSSNGTTMSIFLGSALFIILLNSLLHNSSLVTGSEYIWILFMLLIKSLEFERASDAPPAKSGASKIQTAHKC